MAGAGYKLFNTGDVLLASEVNTYLQQQTVMVFASSAARTTALSGVLAEGMMSYLQDTNSVEVYNGSSWVNVGNAGDITGVTAGTGISGGGSSGDVTITNSMATAIDAKGDLIVGTGADTFSRLAVGTNGHTLVADSSTSTGLKWEAPAGGGKVLQVVTSNYSTQTTITSSSYTDTGLSVTITPSSNTSKVLVLVSQPLLVDQSANQANGITQLLRGATALITDQVTGIYAASSTSGTSLHGMVVFSYLDSPATTSATTYKTQGKKDGNTQLRYQITPTTSSITVLEIGA